MPVPGDERLFMAGSVAEALAALADRGAEGAAFAGGTSIMRLPIWRAPQAAFYVGLGRIPELNAIDVADDRIRIGACVTHNRLTARLAGIQPCSGLVTAAGSAATPAIRGMATVGGNLCSWHFSAADLPPPLLCLDAEVELRTTVGVERISVERFLATRQDMEPGTLVTAVIIPRRPFLTGNARLLMRTAGDNPVTTVSLAAMLGQNGLVEDIRIAVGSVERSARRWPQIESRLMGRPLDPEMAGALAKTELDAFTGRDGIDAPGWYRVQVLPALVRRAAAAALRSRS